MTQDASAPCALSEVRDVRPPRSLNISADDMRSLLAMSAPESDHEVELVERMYARLRGRPVSDGKWRERESWRSREVVGAKLGLSGRTVERMYRTVQGLVDEGKLDVGTASSLVLMGARRP